MAPNFAPTEILALARVIDDIDYYQLLHIERGASVREVKQAYYFSSRAFHPDVNRHLPDELRDALAKIAKRVTEAYSILRDPRRSKAYLEHLEKGNVRMQLAEAEAEADRQAKKDHGRTAEGRQYYNLAATDLRRSDYAAAVRNLQTALTFEPDNEFFKAQLKEARSKLD
jgi:curved DNA-binding protein CbpA